MENNNCMNVIITAIVACIPFCLTQIYKKKEQKEFEIEELKTYVIDLVIFLRNAIIFLNNLEQSQKNGLSVPISNIKTHFSEIKNLKRFASMDKTSSKIFYQSIRQIDIERNQIIELTENLCRENSIDGLMNERKNKYMCNIIGLSYPLLLKICVNIENVDRFLMEFYNVKNTITKEIKNVLNDVRCQITKHKENELKVRQQELQQKIIFGNIQIENELEALNKYIENLECIEKEWKYEKNK